jgi:hypothetical protein
MAACTDTFQEFGNRIELAAGLRVEELILVDGEEVLLSLLGAELDMACD